MSTTNPAFARADRDGLARIGRTLHDLRGIRFADGDGGNGGDGADEQLTDAQAQAILAQAIASGAPKDGTGSDGTGSDDAAPWTKENFDPDRAWKRIQNMQADLTAEKGKREQAIKDAVGQAQKDIVASIAKALGGGEQPETDPAKLNASITDLTSKVTEKDTALAAANLRVAVLSNPAIRNANAKLLLANKAFTDSIASAEPTDEAAITAAINQALQANAALKATPSRSGSGEHQGATVQSLEAQLAAAQTAGDKTETIRLKIAIAAARRRAKA